MRGALSIVHICPEDSFTSGLNAINISKPDGLIVICHIKLFAGSV